MKAYILFEMQEGRRCVYEYDSAVWASKVELLAYIANRLELPGEPQVTKLANNSWQVSSGLADGGMVFEIVEVELNGIHVLEVSGFTEVTLLFEPALRRYVLDGVLSEGSFKWYLLTGQLFEAYRKADSGNLRQMRELVEWIHRYAPNASYGSVENVRSWNNKEGLQGLGDSYVKHWERQFEEDSK